MGAQDKPRVALITDFLPSASMSGGCIRVLRLARALSKRFEVVLYTREYTRDVESARTRDLSRHEELRCFSLIRINYIKTGLTDAGEILARYMSMNDPLAEMIRRDHAEKPFVAAVAEQLYSANVARALAPVPFILDEHNIESGLVASFVAEKSYDEISPETSARILAYEAEVWNAARTVCCVSPEDAAHVSARRRTPAVLIPNGTDVDALQHRLPSQREGFDVIFVGTFFWPPNIAAARFLAHEVMPRVQRVEPRARLVLCGQDPGQAAKPLESASIEVTGLVPSVAPYLERATVFANALTFGGGSSLKTIEALASGVPLVSTPVGVRGFSLEEGRHYRAAKSADEFTREILAVLADRARFDEQSRAGRAFAEDYGWERIGERFADVVEQAARA